MASPELIHNDPFHDIDVDTTVHSDVHMPNPDGSRALEREDDYTRNEEINDLVEKVRSGAWQREKEEERRNHLYGRRDGLLRRVREWLGGENDFTYNEQTGQMVHNRLTEFARRGTNVAWKTGLTAATSLILGSVTGGVGAVSTWAIAGSGIARAGVETWRSLVTNENSMREDILLARERYYKKATEMANRIPLADPPNRETMTPEETAAYFRERHQAIESLVNYIFSSERNTVVPARDRGNVDNNGTPIERNRPYINTQVNGEPIIQGYQPGDPLPPTGGPGPTLNTGTEVNQPSNVSPGVSLDELEKRLEEHNRKWDKREEGLALAGSLIGGIGNMISHSLHVGKDMLAGLARGDAIRLDLNCDGIYHGVQQVTESVKQSLGISQDFVFNYNTAAEAGEAAVRGASIISGVAENGSHILNQSLNQLTTGVYLEGLKQSLNLPAAAMLGSLLTRATWRKFTRRNEETHQNETREADHREQEISRERYLPESRETELKREAREMLLPYPKVGDHWMFQDANDPQNYHHIIVSEVSPQYHDVIITYEEIEPELAPQRRVRQMSVEDLLHRPDAHKIITAKTQTTENNNTSANQTEEENSEIEQTNERESRDIKEYHTAAEHLTREEQCPTETFFFDQVRKEEQIIISINNDIDNQELQNTVALKEFARLIRDAYDRASDVSNKKRLFNQIYQNLNERNGNNHLNFSIMITLPDGKYFAFRTSNCHDQGFLVHDGRSTSIFTERQNDTHNHQFAEGQLQDKDHLALLDFKLSRRQFNNIGIQDMNERINNVLSSGLSPEDQAAELNQLGLNHLNSDPDFCAIITRYNKPEPKKDDPKDKNKNKGKNKNSNENSSDDTDQDQNENEKTDNENNISVKIDGKENVLLSPGNILKVKNENKNSWWFFEIKVDNSQNINLISLYFDKNKDTFAENKKFNRDFKDLSKFQTWLNKTQAKAAFENRDKMKEALKNSH